jgi:molecular chaperone DnaJ
VIEVPDAVLGKKAEIPTLEGYATVTIPPGTQPGTVLRLRGEGLPIIGSESRGDLYLSVHVHVPEELTDQQHALYERLRVGCDEKTGTEKDTETTQV